MQGQKREKSNKLISIFILFIIQKRWDGETIMIEFTKRVGNTIAKGRITLPKEWDEVLDNSNYCPIRHSVDITYCLQSGVRLYGRIYKSINNTTTYYQFYLPDQADTEKFCNQIGAYREIRIAFDLSTNCLHISHKT